MQGKENAGGRIKMQFCVLNFYPGDNQPSSICVAMMSVVFIIVTIPQFTATRHGLVYTIAAALYSPLLVGGGGGRVKDDG